ncbi:unnamed protein product [Rhizophagus irregularis]|nr:unnamed protein product [Rhizophagus irregularis]
MSEQLSERDKEIEKVRASLKISRSENQELNERIMELQEEKEFCVKHNTSLLEELDKLRKEGEVTRLSHRLKQYQTPIDTLERERELVSRKRYSLSSDSTLKQNISPTSRHLIFKQRM